MLRTLTIAITSTLGSTTGAAGVALAQDEPVRLELGADFELELEAAWEPFTDSVYRFDERQPLVQAFAPAEERRTYGADAFRALLPPDPVRVGDLWRVDVEAVLVFLRQLHEGATGRLHHIRMGDQIVLRDVEGAWACLREVGPSHAEVLLRAHPDFVLDGSGERRESSFFTPAQFEGRLLLDRERGRVASFSLSLPDASANCDVNIAAHGGVTVDIGRVPRMEVVGGSAIEPAPTATASLALEEARGLLAEAFYPVATIDWLPLDEALAASKESGKPLHVLALFGALLDESC